MKHRIVEHQGLRERIAWMERRNCCEANMVQDEPGEVESGLCTEHNGKTLLDLKQGFKSTVNYREVGRMDIGWSIGRLEEFLR